MSVDQHLNEPRVASFCKQEEFGEKKQEILKDIDKAIEKVSEKEGYTIVFNELGVVYKKDALNITDLVIKEINK